MPKWHMSEDVCPLLDVSIFRVVTSLSSPTLKYLWGDKVLMSQGSTFESNLGFDRDPHLIPFQIFSGFHALSLWTVLVVGEGDGLLYVIRSAPITCPPVRQQKAACGDHITHLIISTR